MKTPGPEKSKFKLLNDKLKYIGRELGNEIDKEDSFERNSFIPTL